MTKKNTWKWLEDLSVLTRHPEFSPSLLCARRSVMTHKECEAEFRRRREHPTVTVTRYRNFHWGSGIELWANGAYGILVGRRSRKLYKRRPYLVSYYLPRSGNPFVGGFEFRVRVPPEVMGVCFDDSSGSVSRQCYT